MKAPAQTAVPEDLPVARRLGLEFRIMRHGSWKGPAMQSRSAAAHPDVDQPWFIVGRFKEYDGEERANLLRIIGIAAFYVIELINRYGLRLGFLKIPPVVDVDERFHLAVTALAIAWTMVALGVWLCLKNQIFPAPLKYITTG